MSEAEKPYTKMFDVIAPKQRNPEDKTFWYRCGVAFQNAKSGIITMKLDMVPVAVDDNGQLNLILMEKAI